MRFLRNLTLLSLFIITLISCGGGGGDSATDPNVVFRLFPANYFQPGYSRTYNLTGSFSNGDQVTARWVNNYLRADNYGGNNYWVMVNDISITNTTTGIANQAVLEHWYNSNPATFYYDGYINLTTGTVSGLASPTSYTLLPTTATIGDSGQVGNYVVSDGSTETWSWRLENGQNGQAILATRIRVYDPGGALFADETDRFTINPDGVRTAVSVDINYPGLGLSLSMSGS